MGRYVRTEEELKEYLLSNVIENHEGCWLWRLSCFARGYGQQKHANKNWTTHRLSYHLFVGEIPEEMIVRHRCGNRLCCNPLHLETGTNKDNYNDSVKHDTNAKWVFDQEGSKNPKALFTELEVYYIRSKFYSEQLSIKDLCDKFSCGRWAIDKVINGSNYSCYQEIPALDWKDLDKITHFGFLTRKGYRLGRELVEKGYKLIQIQRELGIVDSQARKIFHQRYKELV